MFFFMICHLIMQTTFRGRKPPHLGEISGTSNFFDELEDNGYRQLFKFSQVDEGR